MRGFSSFLASGGKAFEKDFVCAREKGLLDSKPAESQKRKIVGRPTIPFLTTF
jgi:hypothetical protein